MVSAMLCQYDFPCSEVIANRLSPPSFCILDFSIKHFHRLRMKNSTMFANKEEDEICRIITDF